MIQDQFLMKAVSGIRQRSEKQQDLQKLLGSFVDVGILPQINNVNNQIIYGRRGTGKTHVLRVLASNLNEDANNAVVYIDARTLGSTSQFSDPTEPLKQRCLALFRDILVEIYNTLLDYMVNHPTENADAALESLYNLSKVMTEPVSRYTIESVSSRQLDKTSEASSFDASIDSKTGVGLTIKDGSSSSLEQERTASYRVTEEDKVIFPALHSLLKEVLDKAHTALFILLDEWSSIPLDIQPYLAEFIKRAFLPNPQVVVKIASLEYRSNFGQRDELGQILGFEIGSDISTALDIDDYYVYDRNAESVTEAFADMLYKHLKSELPDKYMESNYSINSGSRLASRMFTNRSAFEELVRASEGVARDLINIFSTAYFAAHRRSRENIEKKAILEAARQWFEQDKQRNLDDELASVLERIVQEVIGHRRARSFLLPRDLEKHPVIQRLFDARVLHLMQRGYADKDNPGVRYNIYTLDYGTYVDLINTSSQPALEFLQAHDNVPNGFIVPFDDKRSIRRIILTKEILDQTN